MIIADVTSALLGRPLFFPLSVTSINVFLVAGAKLLLPPGVATFKVVLIIVVVMVEMLVRSVPGMSERVSPQ